MLDDSLEARRERIRLNREARKRRESGMQPQTPSSSTGPPPQQPGDLAVVSVTAKRQSPPPEAVQAAQLPSQPIKRRKLDIFKAKIAALPERQQGLALTLFNDLVKHHESVKQFREDLRAERRNIDEHNPDAALILRNLQKVIDSLTIIEVRIADRRRLLMSGDLPEDLAGFAIDVNTELNRAIQNEHLNVRNNAAQEMSMKAARDASQANQMRARMEARMIGLPPHPQNPGSMPRFQQQQFMNMPAPLPRSRTLGAANMPAMATVRRPQQTSGWGELDSFEQVEDELASGHVEGVPDGEPVDLNADEVSFEESKRRLLDHAGEDIAPVDLPDELNVSVLEHQRKGLAWLLKQENSSYKGGVLADDMGLGKTVQTIAIIYANPPPPELRWHEKMTLIICPLSLIETWCRELENRVKEPFRHRVYVHNASVNKSVVNSFHDSGIVNNTRVVVTTYETIANEWACFNNPAKRRPTPLFKHNWFRVVLDEAHNIKNPMAKRSIACANLRSQYRLCLTGTPMQNSLKELWPLLRFLKIEPFWDNIKRFNQLLPSKRKEGQTSADFQTTEKDKMVQLQEILDGFLLRRTKYTKINNVPILSNLPPKTQYEVYLKMTPTEFSEYSTFESSMKDKAKSMMDNLDGSRQFGNILVLLLRMRQWACHPYLEKLTSEVWAPCPPKQTIEHVREIREMSPHALDIAVNALEANSGQDLNPDMLRLCTACGEVLPCEITMIVPCGHQLCSTCVKTLPNEYPGQVPGSGVCPVCESLVANAMVLSLVHLVHRNSTSSNTEIVQMYTDRRKEMQAVWKRQKEERAIALNHLMDRYDEDTGTGRFSFGDSDSESEEEDLVSDLGNSRGSTPLFVKGEPEVKVAPEVKPEVKPKVERASESASEKSEPGESQSDPDSALTVLSQQETADDDGEADVEAIDGSVLAEKVQARYKVEPAQVARLFHRSNCFKDGWVSSTKVNALMEALFDVWATNPNDKVIVFSFFTSFLDVLTIPLNAARVPYLAYNGEMDAVERNETLRKFQTSSTKLLLISLRTGNAGLTLTEANHVFIMEPFWNPYVEEQAKDRVHRIGQRKPVKVYRFICKDTVEDRIVALQKEKMELIEAALKNPQLSAPKSLSRGDLLFALGLRRRGPRPA